LYSECLQDLMDRQRKLAIEWEKFILKKAKANKAQEEAAQRIAAAGAKLNEHKVGLETHE
jgi:hypothetical protein